MCLSYLASPWFDQGLGNDERDEHAKDGYYSFQDYALSKWGYHLEAFIRTGPDLLREPPEDSDHYNRVSRTLSNFAGAYHDDLVPPEEHERIVAAKEQCEAFQSSGFYADLLRIWTHLHGDQDNYPKQRKKVSIEKLDAALRLNRKTLETLATDPNISAEVSRNLTSLYGNYMFKCDRPMCDFFYEGFEDAETRDAHLKRHERPYRCPVVACTLAVFGFSTNKDREKHIRVYHPDDDAASGFRPPPRELVEDAKFRCNDCGKNFTRKANRDAHVRSHYGQRPFECSTCDKAFTRVNDLRRHEKKRHTRQRR